MTSTTTHRPLNQTTSAVRPARPDLVSSLARRAVLRVFGGLAIGRMRLIDGDESRTFGIARADAPDVTVRVHDRRFYSAVALSGSVGAGESYTQGWWSCDDLTAVVRLFVVNSAALERIDSGWAKLAAPLYAVGRLLTRNTLAGSRRNIAAHYDLSNEFFALWLDPSMMYSAAIYEDAGMSLAEAQRAKLLRVGAKLGLSPSDHLLEIGTGWGGMAIAAAREFGCRVTTTTISAKQAEYARRAVREAGLESRVSVVEHDYRKLPGVYGDGAFTKLVSLEMIEAVGADHLDEYMSVCSRVLRDDGRALIQAILIADSRYKAALRTPDFIQKHIFPGSFIPSHAALAASAAKGTDFTLAHAEEFGTHYARTLREWRDRFLAKLDDVRALGFDEQFIRMWEYYLCYCEGAFAERHISVAQLVYRKPGDRSSQTPTLRAITT